MNNDGEIIMNYFTVFLIFFVNFIFQTTIFQYFEIFGVIPNTTLLLVLFFSFLFKEKFGIVYGVIFGILQDVFFGDIVGIAAFIYFTIGLLTYEMKSYVYKDTFFTPVIITLIGGTYYHLMYWLLMRLFASNINFLFILKNVYVIEIIYDVLIALVIYKLLFKRIFDYDYRRYG